MPERLGLMTPVAQARFVLLTIDPVGRG